MRRLSPPRSRRVLGALTLLGLCLLLPVPALAQKVADPQDEYWEMVRLYASGEHAAALATLGGWTEEQVRRRSAELSAGVVTVRKCPGCPTRLAYSRSPLRAALLLHADRELQEQFDTPLSEQMTPCGMGEHAIIIEHLAAILILIDPTAGDFVKALYLAMARQAQWSHCPIQSQLWARAGLRWFSRDPALLMAEGIAIESSAFFVPPPAPRTLADPPSFAWQRDAIAKNLRTQWENARRAFEATLAAAPDLVEARLRLGRVLWRLGKGREAQTCFEAVLASPAEAHIQYLAHLFLGRVLEDNQKRPEAEEHYRTALAMQPRSETAAVALSHIRFLAGDAESAQRILKEGLESAQERTEFDPWIPYTITQTPDGERILAGLRQGVRP